MMERVLTWSLNVLLALTIWLFVDSGLLKGIGYSFMGFFMLPLFGILQPTITLLMRGHTKTLPRFFKRMTNIYWILSFSCVFWLILYWQFFEISEMGNLISIIIFPLLIALYQQVNLSLQAVRA